MRNHGLVHYFTLDFIPCVLSWNLDHYYCDHYCTQASFYPNFEKSHVESWTHKDKKIMSYRTRYYVTGSMIVHQVSMDLKLTQTHVEPWHQNLMQHSGPFQSTIVHNYQFFFHICRYVTCPIVQRTRHFAKRRKFYTKNLK